MIEKTAKDSTIRRSVPLEVMPINVSSSVD